MRMMMPDYLKQFLLVAAADPYYRDCPKMGFEFIAPRAQERAKRSERSGTGGRLSSKNGHVRHQWSIALGPIKKEWVSQHVESLVFLRGNKDRTSILAYKKTRKKSTIDI